MLGIFQGTFNYTPSKNSPVLSFTNVSYIVSILSVKKPANLKSFRYFKHISHLLIGETHIYIWERFRSFLLAEKNPIFKLKTHSSINLKKSFTFSSSTKESVAFQSYPCSLFGHDLHSFLIAHVVFPRAKHLIRTNACRFQTRLAIR